MSESIMLLVWLFLLLLQRRHPQSCHGHPGESVNERVPRRDRRAHK